MLPLLRETTGCRVVPLPVHQSMQFRERGMRDGKGRVALQRCLIKILRDAPILAEVAWPRDVRYALQIEEVGFRVRARWFPNRSALGAGQRRAHSRDDALCDVALHDERVIRRSVIALCPNGLSGERVHEPDVQPDMSG